MNKNSTQACLIRRIEFCPAKHSPYASFAFCIANQNEASDFSLQNAKQVRYASPKRYNAARFDFIPY